VWWQTAAFSHTPQSYLWVLSPGVESVALSQALPSLLHLPKKLLSRRRFCDVPDLGVRSLFLVSVTGVGTVRTLGGLPPVLGMFPWGQCGKNPEIPVDETKGGWSLLAFGW